MTTIDVCPSPAHSLATYVVATIEADTIKQAQQVAYRLAARIIELDPRPGNTETPRINSYDIKGKCFTQVTVSCSPKNLNATLKRVRDAVGDPETDEALGTLEPEKPVPLALKALEIVIEDAIPEMKRIGEIQATAFEAGRESERKRATDQPWGALEGDKDDPNFGRECGACGQPIRAGERYKHHHKRDAKNVQDVKRDLVLHRAAQEKRPFRIAPPDLSEPKVGRSSESDLGWQNAHIQWKNRAEGGAVVSDLVVTTERGEVISYRNVKVLGATSRHEPSTEGRKLATTDRVEIKWSLAFESGRFLEDGEYVWSDVVDTYGERFKDGEAIIAAGFLYEHDSGMTIRLVSR